MTAHVMAIQSFRLPTFKGWRVDCSCGWVGRIHSEKMKAAKGRAERMWADHVLKAKAEEDAANTSPPDVGRQNVVAGS